MNELQKNISVWMLFPLFMLLLGFMMMWLLLGSEVIAKLRSLVPSLCGFTAIFAFVGLYGGLKILTLAPKHTQFLNSPSAWSQLHRYTLFLVGSLILISMLCSSIVYLDETNEKGFFKAAFYLATAGLGYLTMLGMIFIGASVAHFKSR